MGPPGAIDSLFLLFNLAQPRFVFPGGKQTVAVAFA